MNVSAGEGTCLPAPREGFGLLLVSWSLFALGTLALSSRERATGAVSLAALEVGALLLPGILWGAARGVAIFPVSRLGPRGALQVALMAGAGPAAALGLAGILGALGAGRDEEQILDALVLGYEPWARLVLFALLPAICEEVLFRGAFLSCLRAWGETPACLASAAAFGFFHGSFLRFLPVAALGYGLALCVRRTGSLWPALVVHALHNGLVLALVPLQPVCVPPVLYGALLSLGVFLFALAAVVKGGQGTGEKGETAKG